MSIEKDAEMVVEENKALIRRSFEDGMNGSNEPCSTR